MFLAVLALMNCPAATVQVVDGGTIRACGERVRLAAIDAPELPGHCIRGRVCTPGDGWGSKANLERMIAGRAVQLQVIDVDHYARLVACVTTGAEDLSHTQVAGGFAIERYRPLTDCDHPHTGPRSARWP